MLFLHSWRWRRGGIASSHCLHLHPWHSGTALLTPHGHQCSWLMCTSLLSQVIVADHYHHCCRQHPPSPPLLLRPSFVVHSTTSFPHAAVSFSSSSPSPSLFPYCLIVVCCWLSSLLVIMLSPFSSSRSLTVPAPYSSAPINVFLHSLPSLSCLFDWCVHSRGFDRRSFSSVNTSQIISQVIIVTIVAVVSGVHSAEDGIHRWRRAPKQYE